MSVRDLERELDRQRALAKRHVPAAEKITPITPRSPRRPAQAPPHGRGPVPRGGRAHGRGERPDHAPRRAATHARPALPDKQPKHAKQPRTRPLARIEKRQYASRAMQQRARGRRHLPGVFRAGTTRTRLLAFLIVAVVVFGAILFRITMLQTTEAKSYIVAGTAQRTEKNALRASRGVIFDRNGDELALSVPATTIFVDPRLVLDPVGTAAVLASTLQLSPEKQESLVTAMSDKTKHFVYVARQINESTGKTVMALKLSGVGSYTEDTRVVPGGALARGVIGKTDTDGKGIAGLELQYDELLTGTDGELVQEHDTNGNAIPGSGTVSVPAVPGDDLVLTIDRSIQFGLEQSLLDRVSSLAAKGGTAVVMETGTGNILAMASVERYDDGTYHVTSANLAAVACQEPGSVAKVITTSGALNDNWITPETTFEVPGYRVYDKNTQWEHTIFDAEPHGTELMTVRDILVHSSNLGTVLESERLGPQRQYDYMTAFGLGQKTALNFPSETAGQLKPWEKWQGTENVTMAYGYGFCATPVQLVSAVNVIANNGVYVAPRLVQSVVDQDGNNVDTPPSATHTVVRPEVAQEMNTMMQAVVCEGTGEQAQIDGISVAGKTGTGVKAVDGKYGKQGVDAKYYSSFIGFFPAEKPAVTTLISIDEPPDGDLNHFGGTAAAPVFQSLVPTVMHQLGIQPPTDTGGCPPT